MLVAADIMAAKLLSQLGYVEPDVLRQHLQATAADPDTRYDLVNRLTWELLLDQSQYKQIRHYVAMYEHLRQEALFLAALERRGRAKDEVYQLIAEVERHAYRCRLGDLLVHLGQLTREEQQELEQEALLEMRKNDAVVVNHFCVRKFAGIEAPLIPGGAVTPTSFRLPLLFRSEQTLQMVDRKLREGGPADAGAGGQDPFLESAGKVSAKGVSLPGAADTKRIERARLEEQPSSEAGAKPLEPLERIGPYEVLERLGSGCMGAVYLGRRSERSEIVALKVMTGEEDQEERRRFLREAQFMQRFEHPHVVGLLDCGKTAEGREFIALPAITGSTLREIFLQEPGFQGLEPARALRYFEQLLEGLGHVHERGVVHRDVKPENVLILLGKDEVKLVDFGIARAFSSEESNIFRTAMGSISGSPAYIAPETICGDVIDGRTDLYSAGVLLFEMLTGNKPLRASSPYAFLKEHMVAVPSTLKAARPGVPWDPELERLVAQLLAKHREDRPASCGAVLEQLRGGLTRRVLERVANPPQAGTESDVRRGAGLLNRFFSK